MFVCEGEKEKMKRGAQPSRVREKKEPPLRIASGQYKTSKQQNKPPWHAAAALPARMLALANAALLVAQTGRSERGRGEELAQLSPFLRPSKAARQAKKERSGGPTLSLSLLTISLFFTGESESKAGL